MILATAGAQDAEILAGLHASAFDTPWSATEIAALLDGAGTFALTASDEAGIGGFILCRTVLDEAEVLTLATAPDRRRQGIARVLLDQAMATVRDKGAATLFLEVAEDNHPAIALYAGAGFARIGARARYYSRPDGAIGALVMSRDLNR